MEDDTWIEALEKVNGTLIKGTYRISTKVLLEEELRIPPERQHAYMRTRLRQAMERLGWTYKVFRMKSGTVRGFERQPEQAQLPLEP